MAPQLDPAPFKAALEADLADFGTPDVVVNVLNASGPEHRLEDVENAQWLDNLRGSLTRTLVAAQTYGAAMLERESGVIITVLAGAGKDTVTQITDDAAIGLIRVLAVEWASSNVRVLAIAPEGPGSPDRDDEVARTIDFLASNAASYITGATLVVKVPAAKVSA